MKSPETLKRSYATAERSSQTIMRIAQDFQRYAKDLQLEELHYAKGEILMEDGVANDQLYIILEGEVELRRRADNKQMVYVDSLKPGSFLGLLSFWSDAPTFTQSRAAKPVRAMRIGRKDFENMVQDHPKATLALQTMLTNSLADRYRNMVLLNIAVHHLTEQLETDRNRLKQTVKDLEDTRGQLVTKERLALLGKLLAGIAHEINNPSAALLQSVDALMTEMPACFDPGAPLEKLKTEGELLQKGMESRYMGSSQMRERMALLEKRYPDLDRRVLRRLVPLSDTDLAVLEKDIKKAAKSKKKDSLFHKLRFFDVGANLKSIQLSITRISNLVTSLKSYSRPTTPHSEPIPAKEMILNTLTVVNHRLKHYEVDVDLERLPENHTIPPQINQVVSNILINACDATPEGGLIRVEGWQEKDTRTLYLVISDTGTGISEANLKKIFEPNFTTKSLGGDFGLGLGLAISRDIVERYGGSLLADNNPEKGARFTLVLPPREMTRDPFQP
jgi:signal transduction histidine kinase